MYEAYAHELRSQTVPPERLAQIAYECPELHEAVAAHPNVYPELVVWIEQTAAMRAVPAEPAVQAAPVTLADPAVSAASEAPVVTAPAAAETMPAPLGQAEAEAVPAPASVGRGGRASALLAGIGIGVVAGGLVSAVLLIWVLPGVFGSIIG